MCYSLILSSFGKISCYGSSINSIIFVQRLYQDMENRIELAKKLGRVSKSALIEHKGFSNWDSYKSKSDHDAMLHV